MFLVVVFVVTAALGITGALLGVRADSLTQAAALFITMLWATIYAYIRADESSSRRHSVPLNAPAREEARWRHVCEVTFLLLLTGSVLALIILPAS